MLLKNLFLSIAYKLISAKFTGEKKNKSKMLIAIGRHFCIAILYAWLCQYIFDFLAYVYIYANVYVYVHMHIFSHVCQYVGKGVYKFDANANHSKP